MSPKTIKTLNEVVKPPIGKISIMKKSMVLQNDTHFGYTNSKTQSYLINDSPKTLYSFEFNKPIQSTITKQLLVNPFRPYE